MKEAGEDERKHWKREVESEEEKTVIERRCVNPISSDGFQEFRSVDESECVGDFCVFSVCVLAVSLSVPVLTDALVSPWSVSLLGEGFPFAFCL